MMELKEIIAVLEREGSEGFIEVINSSIKPYRIINVKQKAEELLGLMSGEVVIEKKPANDTRADYQAFEEELVAYWNGFVKVHPNLTAVLKISSERRKRIKLRYESGHFRENIKKVIERIAKSPFLLGQKGWKVNFDYLIANDNNYVKILEGKFEDGQGGIHKFIK